MTRGRIRPKPEGACLYGNCMKAAEPQPEGHGFRFCDLHLHYWERVRDRPRGRAFLYPVTA